MFSEALREKVLEMRKYSIVSNTADRSKKMRTENWPVDLVNQRSVRTVKGTYLVE